MNTTPLTAASPFALFIDHLLVSKGLAPKTRRDYGRYLHEFDAFTGHVSLEEALTLDLAAQWVETLRPRGAFAARNSATYLKSMASWVAKSRYIVIPGGGSLLAGLEKPRVPKNKRRNLSDEQLALIWDALSDRPNRDRLRGFAYVKLLAGSGLRRNEARQLLLANVHLEGRVPYLHVDATTSKGQKERDVRLDPDAVEPILAYLAVRPKVVGDDLPLFLTEDGAAFTENGWGTWCDRIGKDIFKATGIRWYSHLMRHTWATNYHRGMQYSGNSIFDMQSEGGWANIAIVQTYAHARDLSELLTMQTPTSALREHKAQTA